MERKTEMAISYELKSIAPLSVGYHAVTEKLSALVARYKDWSAQNAVRAELMAMSDRDLEDIGIRRADIRHLDLSKDA
jgi:uncharacterized protein YjiS (DUF1127 family)